MTLEVNDADFFATVGYFLDGFDKSEIFLLCVFVYLLWVFIWGNYFSLLRWCVTKMRTLIKVHAKFGL